jgi:hypothetical protein
MDDYPHFFLAKDGNLCSMGLHCLGFPRVLYDALLRLGYNGKVPIYHCRLSVVDSLDICDTTIKQTTHITLTSLCVSRPAATAAMLIVLFPIQNQENPVWKQHLEAMSDLEGPHFNAGMAAMAKYMQYRFNL